MYTISIFVLDEYWNNVKTRFYQIYTFSILFIYLLSFISYNNTTICTQVLLTLLKQKKIMIQVLTTSHLNTKNTVTVHTIAQWKFFDQILKCSATEYDPQISHREKFRYLGNCYLSFFLNNTLKTRNWKGNWMDERNEVFLEIKIGSWSIGSKIYHSTLLCVILWVR